MEISQLGFVLLVLCSAAGGFLLGIVYDVLLFVRGLLGADADTKGKWTARIEEIDLPIIKKKLRPNVHKAPSRIFRDVAAVVCDTLFAILCGIAVILISYAYNGGLVRFAVILGVALGFVLCRCLLGEILGRVLELVVITFRIFFEYLREIVICPIKLLKCMILKINGIKNKRKGAKNETR
jgi:hypothetical protein